MPVVNLEKSRLERLLPGTPIGLVVETLPFIGLDIEGMDDQYIRVEYNPNRPDFSSDYGIARALKGLLGIETGLPKFHIAGVSGISIQLELGAVRLRPVVAGLVAEGGRLDEQDLKQLIAMQEDLHNGLGRRRKKASIGIHSLDAIKPPIRYTTRRGDFSFAPLGEDRKMSISQIFAQTAAGRTYTELAGQRPDEYPLLIDGAGTVLSVPPIINGSKTRLESGNADLFVEVTGTDENTSDDILAIIAANLSDMGYRIKTVNIQSARKKVITPSLSPKELGAKKELLCDVLGLELTSRILLESMRKCRLGAKLKGGSIVCTVPRYRTDIHSEIDLAEELAIGYGIQGLNPSLPSFFSAGSATSASNQLNIVRRVMVGMGMVENLSFSLTNSAVLLASFTIDPMEKVIAVDSPKSVEHEILRVSLLPSLLVALSRNIHEEYPQRIFEIGRVFEGKDDRIMERWSICGVTAHADADYAESKSVVQTLLEVGFGISKIATTPSERIRPHYIPGRAAILSVLGKIAGELGEVKPEALEYHRLRMPVSAFEIDLSSVLGI